MRVGERLYSQSIGDASGVMPPKSDTPAYFAITGSPSGGRNDVSTKNDFAVLLTTLEEVETKGGPNALRGDRKVSAGKREGFSK